MRSILVQSVALALALFVLTTSFAPSSTFASPNAGLVPMSRCCTSNEQQLEDIRKMLALKQEETQIFAIQESAFSGRRSLRQSYPPRPPVRAGNSSPYHGPSGPSSKSMSKTKNGDRKKLLV